MLCPAWRSTFVVSFVLIAFLVFNGWSLHTFLFIAHDISLRPSSRPPYPSSTSSIQGICDVSHGSWVLDTRQPIYTNDSCGHIDPDQNCMQHGRPDRGYLDWRWKPSHCELPPFDGAHFLNMMKGKSLVMIGDSIARNHMQSLQCALAQVEEPQNVYSHRGGKAFTWHYPSHNFTLANIWSPFLLNYSVEESLYKLQLDVPDVAWTSQLHLYDVAIVSTGYWYFRPLMYLFNDTVYGANSASGLNVTIIKLVPILQVALKTVFNYLAKEYRGLIILRTVTVDHFEHGSWSEGGVCNRTMPFADDADDLPSLPYMNTQINRVQIEEFEKAFVSSGSSWRQRILNVTYSAFLRPDGHPGPYRTQTSSTPVHDCLHWCLPGPIDMWNQLVLYTLEHFLAQKGLNLHSTT